MTDKKLMMIVLAMEMMAEAMMTVMVVLAIRVESDWVRQVLRQVLCEVCTVQCRIQVHCSVYCSMQVTVCNMLAIRVESDWVRQVLRSGRKAGSSQFSAVCSVHTMHPMQYAVCDSKLRSAM